LGHLLRQGTATRARPRRALPPHRGHRLGDPAQSASSL